MRESTIITILFFVFAISAPAQNNEFTFQGSLKDGATAANGSYDFEFALFDSVTGGTQQGATLTRSGVEVSSGAFSVKLDFGSQFPGAGRFLETHVRPAGNGSFTVLSPRQQISNTPYAMRSLNAANADSATNATSATTATNALQLGGVAASQYVVTTDPRMSDARAASSVNFGTTSLSGTLPLANGGTGSSTKNFVDLSTDQTGIGGNKTLTGNLTVNGNLGIGTPNPAGKFHINVPGSGNPIGALTLDVGTFGTGANAVNSYFFKIRDLGLGGTPAFLIRGDGNVGIGTSNPSSKLHVFGNGGLRITADSDSNAGFGLMLNSSPKWSLATVSPGQFQIFNDAIGQNAVWIDPANNNVGIGSTSPAATLEVNGYTKLGSDAPAIRVKKLTGTTAATEGGNVTISHGLDATKILSISVMVNFLNSDQWIGPNYQIAANGYNFEWYLQGGLIRVINATGGSASILSKPIKILIIYEQ